MSPKRKDPQWSKIDRDGDQLEPVAVVAHCLDNQWVPRPMLAEMTRDGLSLDDVHDDRAGYVRAEYLRALLTAEQVVVNRVYFYNNSLVYRDYLVPGLSRTAFATLLRSKAIVPHLHNEESPLQPPADMDLVTEGFDAWVDACHEAEQFSVNRLSWGKDRNKALTDKLGLAFQELVQALAGRAEQGGASEFARHLDLPKEKADALRARLRELQDWAIKAARESADIGKGPITRNAVYLEFVTPPGDNPTSGRCDPNKPFSSEIKQLVDLQYNTGLPEFLDRLPLRPVNTLHRAALRENRPDRPAPGNTDQAALEEVLLSKLAFDNLTDGLDPFNTASLLSLDLPSIVKIRKRDEWRTYVTKLTGLVAEPFLFESHANDVLQAYQELLRLLAEGRPPLSWKTVRQTHLEISGVTLKVKYLFPRPTFEQVGEITGEPPPCRATVRMVMVNRISRGEADPNLTIDTLNADIPNPREFLAQIKHALRNAGYREERQQPQRSERLGGMEQDQEQG
jgi:hypothetical protein